MCHTGWQEFFNTHAEEVKKEQPDKFDPLFSPKREAAIVDLNVELARRWNNARMQAQDKRRRIMNNQEQDEHPEGQADAVPEPQPPAEA